MLQTLLSEEILRRRLSYREAARQIGVSHTTIIAASRGRSVMTDAAKKIAVWLGVPLYVILDETDEGRTFSRLGTLFEIAPDLRKVFIEAAQAVENGELTTDEFKDIVDFAAYKIRRKREKIAEQEVAVEKRST